MPIKVKRTIHTRPMIQPGGVKEGLASIGYQVETERSVKIEPTIPAAWQIKMPKIRLGSSLAGRLLEI
jgi:hypothetical protein